MAITTTPPPITGPASPVAHPDKQPGAPREPRSNPLGRLLGYVLLGVAAVLVLVPFFWMISSSLKTNNAVFSIPIQWIPKDPQWHNYIDIWRKSDMKLWVGNTLLLAGVITLLQLFTGSFAAYGFSRVRFPGRDLLFLLYLATIAVPWQAYMIPQFILMGKLHLTDTRWSIVALQAFGAFGVFLMKQFYETIPEELSEAARIDGLSEYGIYRRIMLPLSGPALASLALLTFVFVWNDYLGPLIYLRDHNLWTIQIGLKSFIGQYNAQAALIMTGSVLSVVPVAVIFLLGQRFFIQGIASSGIKG
jgi:multiple sugar transport system permease protein